MQGADRHGVRVPLTFIGRVEHYDEDMRKLVDLMGKRLSGAEKKALLEPLKLRQGGSDRAKSYLDLMDVGGYGELVGGACTLPGITADFECLGYPSPPLCKQKDPSARVHLFGATW